MTKFADITREIHAKDLLLTERYLSKTPFHSAYWVRKRLDEAIAEHAGSAHGILLDVGCGLKPYRSLIAPHATRYIGLDYSPESGYRGNAADLCGDAACLPLADQCVDSILCTEVMVNLPDPEQAISEFARVLTKGGTVIATAPFLYPVHDTNDFFRFSRDGLATIMERHGLAVEKIVPLSGTAISLAVMFNLYWYDAGFIWTKWLYPIGLVFRPVLWFFCFLVNITGRFFEIVLPNNSLPIHHLTVAKKI